MISTTTLTLVDGARVVVPDSLDLITSYVLREQLDWFEDELPFVRRLLQPGQNVIDIGANYGVYTLSMAQAVGARGNVWCFEPASTTAAFLAQGIAANGFAHVHLDRSALSSAAGSAQLSLNPNSELNALVHGPASAGQTETVPLTTLDLCLAAKPWRDIEFVKIDAEGEEANILKGGKRFFDALSPLVQYEIKAGADVHLDLVRAFAALGYRSYRLVPGLDLLVPFDPQVAPDGYLLNLLCCKPDRAAALARRGLLLDNTDDVEAAATERLAELLSAEEGYGVYDWRQALTQTPYGAQLRDRWEQTVAAGDSGEVEEALALYAVSRDPALPPSVRFLALEDSFLRLKDLCGQNPSALRRASLARVARDYGAREVAVRALSALSDAMFRDNRVDPAEPFLAPCRRYDTLATGKEVGNWVVSAVLEELERLAAFSSFYSGLGARQRLEDLRDLGFAGEEMQRRLRLLEQRFRLSARSITAS